MTQYSLETKKKTNDTAPSAGAAEESAAYRRSSAVWCVLTSLLLTAAIVLCLLVSLQVRTRGYVDIGGFSLFRVVTGSMEPTISAGELLLCRAAQIESVTTGDIVCYRTELSAIKGAVVTHRVVETGTDKDGRAYLVTQGDANLVADSDLVRKDELIGRVVWYSGKESVLNDALSFLTSQVGFLTCIVLPVLLAAGLILQSAVKNLYQEIAYFKSELNRCVEDMEREEEQEEDGNVMPGYTVLTRADYEELWRTVRAELIEELEKDVVPEKGAGPEGGTTE